MAKNNKTTIEHLAGMVQGGFEGVDKKFEGVDKKLDLLTDDMRLVRDRLDAIEMELIDIKKKLENVIDRREFEVLKERVHRLERILANNKKK